MKFTLHTFLKNQIVTLFLPLFLTLGPIKANAQWYLFANCFNNNFNARLNTTKKSISSCKDTVHLGVLYKGTSNSVYWNDGYYGKDRVIKTSGYYQAAVIDDSSLCADTTEWIYVTVNDTKLSIYSFQGASPISVCKEGKIELYAYSNSQSFPKKYRWNTGDTVFSVYVKTSGDYYVISESVGGCIDTSNKFRVNIIPNLNLKIKANSDTIICDGDSVELECNQNYKDMKWYPVYQSGKKIKVGTEGEYYVYANDTIGFCANYSNKITVIVKKAPPTSICMVTADSATGKNKIIWKNKGEKVTKYVVFREGNIAYQFENIGEVKNNDSIMQFIDSTSVPKVRAYTYFVGGIDSCGNFAQENKYYTHTTSHLTASLGVNGENNLSWSDYLGIYPIESYAIYRSNNGGQFKLLSTVSTNVKSYTDLEPPKGSNRYYIGIIANNECTKSNGGINSNTVAFGILGDEDFQLSNFKLFPNPAKDQISIQFNDIQRIESIIVTDISGKILISKTQNNPAQFFEINTENLKSGFYQITINNQLHSSFVISR